MAIGHIFVGDVESISKINQAIDKADLVDGKANTTDLTEVSNDLTQVANSLAAETSDREDADDAEASARAAADEARPTFGDTPMPIRPGDAIRYFTGSVDGAPQSVSPLSGDVVATTPDGAVASLNGAGTVATIGVWRVEPGHEYSVRFVVRRTSDTDDPSNDAVRLGVRWLKSDKSGLVTTELANLLDVVVANGRLEYRFKLATVADIDIDGSPPSGGVYFRPFVRTFGGGVTSIEVIEVTDVSLSADWSPDVSEFRREIAGLQAQVQEALDRIQALEGQ